MAKSNDGKGNGKDDVKKGNGMDVDDIEEIDLSQDDDDDFSLDDDEPGVDEKKKKVVAKKKDEDADDEEVKVEFDDVDDDNEDEVDADYNPLAGKSYNKEEVDADLEKGGNRAPLVAEGTYSATIKHFLFKITKEQKMKIFELAFTIQHPDYEGFTFTKAYFPDKPDSLKYLYCDLRKIAPKVSDPRVFGKKIHADKLVGRKFPLYVQIKVLDDDMERNNFYINT